ncbi:hypothetical protein BH10PSE19_BH10PSE19_13370 [soil metagenome]
MITIPFSQARSQFTEIAEQVRFQGKRGIA